MRFCTAALAIELCAAAVLAAGQATTPPAAPILATPSAPAVAILRNGFSLRHDHRQTVGDNTRLYLGPGEQNFVEVPTAEIQRIEAEEPPPPAAAGAAPLPQIVGEAGQRHRIDPDLISSVIQAESGFNPLARSQKGAQGLMQLMPQTASRLGVNQPFDPAANVDGGTRYLRQLLLDYHNDMVKALAAYNAGPARVNQYGGVPPYRETRVYVARVIRNFNRKKLAARSVRRPSTGAANRSPAPLPAQRGAAPAVVNRVDQAAALRRH